MTTLALANIGSNNIINAAAPATWSDVSSSSSYSAKGKDTLTIGDQKKWSSLKELAAMLFNQPADLSISEATLSPLHLAVENKSQVDFSETVSYIDYWETPQMLKEAIDLALSEGWIDTATKLAQTGAKEFPDDPVLQKYARILIPTRLAPNPRPSSPGLKEALEWLKHDGANYRGQWVALRYGQLLGHSTDLQSLKETTKDLPSSDEIIFIRIPIYAINF